MWGRIVICCAVVALAFPTPEESTERMMKPLSAAASGNYTLSFMPLLTVLINMFPRLMSQVRVQPLTTTTQARKLEALWEWERASLCAMVDTMGWTTPDNPCHFYSCRFSNKDYCGEQMRGTETKYEDTVMVTSTALDECITLEVRRCSNPTHQYNPQLASCEQAEQDMCQQRVP